MLSKTVMVLGSFFLWCMWSETDEKNREAKSYQVGEITMQGHFRLYRLLGCVFLCYNEYRIYISIEVKEMKYKLAICDDEEEQREYVLGLVNAWARLGLHLLEIKEFPDAESFLFHYEAEKDFDILLLDVEMKNLSGIDLAKKVRKENSMVQIVFITGYYEYFSDGFDVSALHYLIKPVDERKLYLVLDKAVENLSYRQRSVFLSTTEADIKISLADILYVEAEKVYVKVHTVNEVYRSRISLSKIMEQLDDTF